MAKAKLETDYKDLSMRLYKRIAELEDERSDLDMIAKNYAIKIAELEKENAELRNKLEHRNCLDCSNHSSKLRMRTLELEKECTKATEIIKKLYAVYYDPCVTESDLKYRDELFAEIKQFLREKE